MKKYINKDTHYIAMAITVLIISMFIIACEDSNTLVKGESKANKIKNWTKASDEFDILFSGRGAHTSVTDSEDNIYVIGGYNGMLSSGYLNDVWKLEDDGNMWTRVTANAGFPNRSEHTSVIDSKNNIYVIGGYNGSTRLDDVWKFEDDKKTWTKVTTNSVFPKRSEHTSVIDSKNNIYVIGGYNGKPRGGHLNDVWKFEDDGNTWTLVTANAGFSQRSGHASVIDSAGNIYVIGGEGKDGWLNDVWKSDDEGKTWASVNDGSTFSFFQCSNHTSVIDSDDNIYIIGGYNDSKIRLNDVWKSEDKGNTWAKIVTIGTLSSEWDVSSHTSVIDSADNIYVIGGYNGTNYFNDIWRYGY